MEQLVISADNIALLDLLDERRKASLIDAICAVLRGGEPSGLDDATRIVFASIVRDNAKESTITKSSLVKGVITEDQERIKEKVCTNVHTEKKKERMTVPLEADERVKAAFEDFSRMRKRIKKPMTDLAVSRKWTLLERLSNGDPDLAVKILEQSTDACWQDLYALKEEPKPQTKTQQAIGQRNPKVQAAHGFSTERNETDYNAMVWQRIRERWQEEDGG